MRTISSVNMIRGDVHSGDIIDGLLAGEFPELQLLELGLRSLTTLSNSGTEIAVRQTRGLDHVELRAGLVNHTEDGRHAEGTHVAEESVRLRNRKYTTRKNA